MFRGIQRHSETFGGTRVSVWVARMSKRLYTLLQTLHASKWTGHRGSEIYVAPCSMLSTRDQTPWVRSVAVGHRLQPSAADFWDLGARSCQVSASLAREKVGGADMRCRLWVGGAIL